MMRRFDIAPTDMKRQRRPGSQLARGTTACAMAFALIVAVTTPASAEEWSRGYDECSSDISINSYTLGDTFHSYTPYPPTVPHVLYKGYGYDTRYVTNTQRTQLTNMGVSAERIYSAWPSC